jgi:5S rRNA maturation endonuclease (ribonuclease M5)
MVGHILDLRLVKIAKKHRCTYSRYADDLTFSTNLKDFPDALALRKTVNKHEWEMGAELRQTISKAGFSINAKKTRVQYKNSRQDVTGLVVNKKINIKSDYYRMVRAMCHSLFVSGQFYFKLNQTTVPLALPQLNTGKDPLGGIFGLLWEKLLNKTPPKASSDPTKTFGSINQLSGMIGHIFYVKNLYEKSLTKVTEEDKQREKKGENLFAIRKLYFKFLFYTNFFALEKPLIVCEGKTDNVYLKCAIKNLPASQNILVTYQGRQPDYSIRFFNYSHITKEILRLSGGTGELIKFIVGYKKDISLYKHSGKRHPVIVLIDNDDGANGIFASIGKYQASKKPVDRTLPFYFITENLYIVPTPISNPTDKSCIENFFDQKTLGTVIDGKIFNPSEAMFDKDKEYGKTVFAEKVVRQNQKAIDFIGFQKIIDRILLVVADYKTKI